MATKNLAEVLADDTVRAAVVAELLAQANADDARGERAFAAGQYAMATLAWQLRARRIGAATAIEHQEPVGHRNRTLVYDAATTVLDRRPAAEQPPGGVR